MVREGKALLLYPVLETLQAAELCPQMMHKNTNVQTDVCEKHMCLGWGLMSMCILDPVLKQAFAPPCESTKQLVLRSLNPLLPS